MSCAHTRQAAATRVLDRRFRFIRFVLSHGSSLRSRARRRGRGRGHGCLEWIRSKLGASVGLPTALAVATAATLTFALSRIAFLLGQRDAVHSLYDAGGTGALLQSRAWVAAAQLLLWPVPAAVAHWQLARATLEAAAVRAAWQC